MVINECGLMDIWLLFLFSSSMSRTNILTNLDNKHAIIYNKFTNMGFYNMGYYNNGVLY